LFIPKRGGGGRRQPINYRRFATAAGLDLHGRAK